MTRRKDPVTPQLRIAVLTRDGGCLAPRLDPDAGPCLGRLTLEHVKDQLRLGRRAPSDPAHLAVLCEGHTEPGARAGYQWNTDRRNRQRVREYLRRAA